jgi:hypothetical protein
MREGTMPTQQNTIESSSNGTKEVTLFRRRFDGVDSTSTSAKYLVIDPVNSLGLSQFYYALEIGLSLSTTLFRQLLVTPMLKMRHCLDHSLCRQAESCTSSHGEYRCPIGKFFDEEGMRQSGIALHDIAEIVGLLPEQRMRTVPNFFSRAFSTSEVWVDKIPAKLAVHLSPITHRVDNAFTRLDYYTVKPNCEMTMLSPHHVVYFVAGNRTAYGLFDEFGADETTVLRFSGLPHNLAKIVPLSWTSPARKTSYMSAALKIQYHPQIRKFAEAAAKVLASQSPTNTFNCAHLRRDEFMEVGSLHESAFDTNRIRMKIQSYRSNPSELTFVATDEKLDKNFRVLLRKAGVVYFSELFTRFRMNAHEYPLIGEMMGFEDFTGIVEQQICAYSRSFLGTPCSAFTGRIVTLRTQQGKTASFAPYYG